jgi:hypothetical protein
LRTGAERRRLRRKSRGKDDEDRQARQPGPEKGSRKRPGTNMTGNGGEEADEKTVGS